MLIADALNNDTTGQRDQKPAWTLLSNPNHGEQAYALPVIVMQQLSHHRHQHILQQLARQCESFRGRPRAGLFPVTCDSPAAASAETPGLADAASTSSTSTSAHTFAAAAAALQPRVTVLVALLVLEVLKV